jgi:hypothetical protein
LRDFTLAKYAALCTALIDNRFNSLPLGDFIKDGSTAERLVLLRHDVDSRPKHAVKLAAIEAAHGLRATYFFRTVPGAFDADAVREIAAIGHEVGYHYETMAQARGDIPVALNFFRSELGRLRALAPVKVAAMHGSPLHRWDNRDIWGHAAPEDFGLVGEVYRDIDYSRVIYLNDTGRTWNPTRFNLRDTTGILPPIQLESTDGLIGWVKTRPTAQLCISTHPERWQDGLAWYGQAGRDAGINQIKLVLKYMRR